MDEKEMEKIDEKGEEKISGGMKSSKGEKSKGVLDQIQIKKIDPKVIQAYGGPSIFRPGWLAKRLKDKENEKGKKAEEALTPSQPQIGDKK